MPLTRTTKLQAVNTMLATIGSAPVNQLIAPGSPNSADVAIATNTLDEVSLNVQSRGWHFNTEENIPLTPDPGTKEIYISENVVFVDIERDNDLGSKYDITVRNNKLYNKKTDSFQFTEVVKVKMVRALDWDDLPQAARHYITIRASRIFQDRVVGSDKHHAFTQQDEFQALGVLKKFDGDSADHSIFDNYDVYRVIDRVYPYQF